MGWKLASRPDLQDLIIPKDFAVGYRRPTPGNGDLDALCEYNEAVNDFAAHQNKFLPLTFFKTIATPLWEDYDLKHTTSNRFGYWSNEFAQREQNVGDSAWYLGLLDGVDEQPALPYKDFEEVLFHK
ncbi:steroid monooxygenase [Colletotrichum orchidophilum]|uniref:Steroid monooxygenase n=1 Tax=Colletotrichum orchidophilum TaxID=1209926 RepID=A0A1G4AZV9_9PEZI|nr:steroid monooxygenase [Colletotrichum orchidophilum]OHE94674.1 steroid monooxygenase [Colletotrichum orchidophilum]